MSLLNTASTNNCIVLPYGQQAVSVDGASLLTDTFDGSTIDTVYRWNAPVLAGTGTATLANSNLTLATGTTTSNAAALSSQTAFTRQGFGWLKFGVAARLETSPLLNCHRFWGQGLPQASFTALTPLQDSVGFEVDVNGVLSCSIYAGAVRVFNKVLPYPVDGYPHSYVMHIRDDFVLWFADNLEIPVAMMGYTSPSSSTLPIRFHSINNTTAPLVAPTMVFGGIGLADSSGSVAQIFNGVTSERLRSPGKFITLNAVSVATEATIWTPATGKRFRLMGYQLSSGTVGGNVTLKDNTAGTTIMIVPFGAAAVPLTSPVFGNGIFSATANNVLTATGTATQTLSGYLFGCEE